MVLADGAYEALARASPAITLAHCWAHVRRKFVEAEPHSPAPCAEVLALIGQLYAVERTCPRASPLSSDADRAETLALLHATHAALTNPGTVTLPHVLLTAA